MIVCLHTNIISRNDRQPDARTAMSGGTAHLAYRSPHSMPLVGTGFRTFAPSTSFRQLALRGRIPASHVVVYAARLRVGPRPAPSHYLLLVGCLWPRRCLR